MRLQHAQAQDRNTDPSVLDDLAGSDDPGERLLVALNPSTPDETLDRLAGFLDRVVAPEEVAAVARATAEELKGINMVAHAATKVRIRHRLLADLDDGIARIGDPDREL